MNTFQAILLSAFGILALLGFAFFITGGETGTEPVPPITIWGEVDGKEIQAAVAQLNQQRENSFRVSYRRISGDYEEFLVRQLAQDNSPDIFVISHDQLIKLQDYLQLIPYSVYSQRDFQNNFVESAEVFMADQGIWGVPFAVDPLIMYWNRNLYTNAGFAQPPRFWDQIPDVVDRIRRQDPASNIEVSAIGLGEYHNINNAKAILSTLLHQVGNAVTRKGGESIRATLGQTQRSSGGITEGSADSALRFYTEFSDPTKSVYTWNRALPNSQEMFLSTDLATYFGYASEVPELRQKNPNLNFDVAPVPQIRGGENRKVFGKVYGFAVSRRSQNKNHAMSLIQHLTSKEVSTSISQAVNGVTLRRDVLAEGSPDSYKAVFYDSALITDNWLDPDPDQSNGVFRQMVEDVTSGRHNVPGALEKANQRLQALISSQ